MTELFASFTQYLTTLPWLELIAMILSLCYVFLAAQGSLWCWPAAFISTALYTVIFYDVLLLMDSALNVYYLIMAVYGFWMWRKDTLVTSSQGSQSQDSPLAIVSWQFSLHVKVCLLLTIVSLSLGYIMANYTKAVFPYLDTFTTVFAIFATYLVTQKVLENWLYWLVIDFVSIYLYIEKGLMPTVILFVVYIIIAAYGYIKWQALFKNSQISVPQPIST